MAFKEKIENGVSEYINKNNEKPNFLILHPGFLMELARELFAENFHNIKELSSFFGLRIISSSDVSPNEVILAK